MPSNMLLAVLVLFLSERCDARACKKNDLEADLDGFKLEADGCTTLDIASPDEGAQVNPANPHQWMVEPLGDEGAIAIAKLLKEYKLGEIHRVSAHANKIGPAGFKAIVEAIDHRDYEMLDLHENPYGDEGVIALAEVLKRDKTIWQIDVSSTGMTDVGAKALAEALKVNNQLRELNIAFNKIGNDGANAIFAALKENKMSAMKSMELQGNDFGGEIGQGIKIYLESKHQKSEL